MHDIYARPAGDQLAFGPHGAYSIGRLTKSRRVAGEELRQIMHDIRATGVVGELVDDDELLPPSEELVDIDAIRAKLEPYVGEHPIDDIEDAIVASLAALTALMLDDAPTDLAAKLYADYRSDIIDPIDLTLAVEAIDTIVEQRTNPGHAGNA